MIIKTTETRTWVARVTDEEVRKLLVKEFREHSSIPSVVEVKCERSGQAYMLSAELEDGTVSATPEEEV